MLPQNQKQILQYKVLRFSHIALSMLIIPFALYYSKTGKQGFEFIFCFVAALWCIAFTWSFRMLLYPPDLRRGISVSMGLIVNFIFVIFFAEQGILFSCYYLFFSFLCLQALIILLIAGIGTFKKSKHPELFKHIKKPKNWVLVLAIVGMGSPLIIAPYLLGKPFLSMMNSLDTYDAVWMWVGFVLDLLQQLWIIFGIAFATGYQSEINQRQYKLTEGWQPLLKFVFYLGLMGTFVVMFL